MARLLLEKLSHYVIITVVSMLQNYPFNKQQRSGFFVRKTSMWSPTGADKVLYKCQWSQNTPVGQNLLISKHQWHARR